MRVDVYYMRLGLAVALCSAWALLPRTVLACPDCAVGRAARASVFDDNFALNLLTLLSPLVLLTGIVVMLHRIDAAQPKLKNTHPDTKDTT